MIQVSILKINQYGPWTLTLGSDREHELQMFQASLYIQIQKIFSEKNCLVFLNRADEFFVVSNGLKLQDHVQIQKKLEKLFDVGISISIGYGKTPFEANLSAYKARKNQIVLDKKYNIFGFINETESMQVSIMHLDVEGLTLKQQNKSPYEISTIIFKLYSDMANYFLKTDSLTFFMGGDNFMIIASNAAKKSIQNFINMVNDDQKIALNCGIGNANMARQAAKLATQSLDMIRKIRDSNKTKPDIYEMTHDS